MTAFRTRNRTVVLTVSFACALIVAGVTQSAAQFPPPPGGQGGGGSPFPPPPGQTSQPGNDPFPPAPGGPARSGAPQGGASAFPDPSGGGFGGPRGGGPPPPSGDQAVCNNFVSVRADTEKAANAIKIAGDKKLPREEVCPLFQRFAAAEAKMLKFLTDNQRTCGVPLDAIKTVKTNHGRTLQMRTAVCSAAPRAAGPSLSDALSSPVMPDDNDKKPGRGTYDTLTGSPLAR